MVASSNRNRGLLMKVVTYSQLRANLKSVCDSAIDDCEHVLVHRRDSENVVMMSESEFNSWKETLYLMSDHQAHADLMASIAEVEKGNVKERQLIENF